MQTVKLPENSLWANRKCLGICCIVAAANMQYGFDSAAVGALQAMPGFLKVFGYEDAQSPMGYSIDSTVQQLITSLLTLGSFLSSVIAGPFAAFYGRKVGIWAACVLNVVACIIQIVTINKRALYFGRLLLGFSNGFLVTFSNVYTSEVSPAHLRGVMVALFAYWVNIGSIFGAVVDNYTKDSLGKDSYQIPIGCLFIVPVLLSIGLFLVPESPRYLLHQGQDQQARASLKALRGSSLTPEFIELEWAEMIRGVEEERKTAKSVGWIDMFRGSDLRRTLLCYGMIACQTASGIWFIIGYQTYFLLLGGITKSFEYSIMNTCLGFVGVNVGMYAIRHLVGRRAILMIGAIGCGLCQLAPAIAATVDPNAAATTRTLIAFTAIFIFFYNACVGAASYPVATELVSTRLRAWTVGTATSLGYFLAWLCSFCTPYFINPEQLNWGAKYGYIWAGSNFLCVVFFYIYMPEMKGRSLEELDELFYNKVSVREFPRYHCTVLDEAVHDVQVSTGLFTEKTAATEQTERGA